MKQKKNVAKKRRTKRNKYIGNKNQSTQNTTMAIDTQTHLENQKVSTFYYISLLISNILRQHPHHKQAKSYNRALSLLLPLPKRFILHWAIFFCRFVIVSGFSLHRLFIFVVASRFHRFIYLSICFEFILISFVWLPRFSFTYILFWREKSNKTTPVVFSHQIVGMCDTAVSCFVYSTENRTCPKINWHIKCKRTKMHFVADSGIAIFSDAISIVYIRWILPRGFGDQCHDFCQCTTFLQPFWKTSECVLTVFPSITIRQIFRNKNVWNAPFARLCQTRQNFEWVAR